MDIGNVSSIRDREAKPRAYRSWMSLVLMGEGSEANFQASWYIFDTKQMRFSAYKAGGTRDRGDMLDALVRMVTVALPDVVHCWWSNDDKQAAEQIELALKSPWVDMQIVWHFKENSNASNKLFDDSLQPGDESMSNAIWQCCNLKIEGSTDAEGKQMASSLCPIAIQRLIEIVLESKQSGETRVQLDDCGILTVRSLSGACLLGERLTVDCQTLAELEVVGCESSYNLFALLSNACVSAPGRKLLKSWFQTPLTDGLILQDRLDSVEGLMHQEEIVSNMRGLLKKVGDPVKLLENVIKMQTVRPQIKHFIKLREGFEALLQLQVASARLISGISLKDAKEMQTPPNVLIRLVHSISDELMSGCDLIKNIFDPQQLPEGMYVHYGVSNELDEMKAFLFGLPDLLATVDLHEKSRVPKEFRGGIALSWEIISIPRVGFFLHSHAGLIPGHILDYLEDYELVFEPDTQSLGDAYKGACYSTGTTRELTQRYGDLHEKISDLEAAIANTVSRKLIALLPMLNKAALACAELDCTMSLAEFASNHAMCRPSISSENDMEIIEGRNIIFEQRTAAKCIPNDTVMESLSSNLESKKDGDGIRIHIITGPNASGKTCYLKQIGVISFLAHIGSFVPAKKATLPKIDQIYSRIISQENFNYSSFAYDLSKIKHVLDKSTGRTLVILDEFGCGTLSSDGSAIAAAVILEMATRQRSACPLVFFASHLNEILQERFLASTPRISYFRMTSATHDPMLRGAQKAKLVPLYQLQAGKALESNAISCSKSAGLPEKVVDRAEEVLEFLVNGTVLHRHHEFAEACDTKILKHLKDLNHTNADKLKDYILSFN